MMKFRINSLVRKPPKCYNIDKITRRNFFAFLKDCRVKQAAGECTNNGVCVCLDGERFKVTPLETEAFFNREVMKRLEK